MIAGSMATVAYYTVCITYIRRALPWQDGAREQNRRAINSVFACLVANKG